LKIAQDLDLKSRLPPTRIFMHFESGTSSTFFWTTMMFRTSLASMTFSIRVAGPNGTEVAEGADIGEVTAFETNAASPKISRHWPSSDSESTLRDAMTM
jgi:hypothetical protein